MCLSWDAPPFLPPGHLFCHCCVSQKAAVLLGVSPWMRWIVRFDVSCDSLVAPSPLGAREYFAFWRVSPFRADFMFY